MAKIAELIDVESEQKIATAPREVASLRVALSESDAEAQSLRAFGRSRRVMAGIWNNPDDAEYNDL